MIPYKIVIETTNIVININKLIRINPIIFATRVLASRYFKIAKINMNGKTIDIIIPIM